jgi:hypothetical protein
MTLLQKGRCTAKIAKNNIKMSPDNAFAYGTQAVAYVSLKNYSEAIKTLRQPLNLTSKLAAFILPASKQILPQEIIRRLLKMQAAPLNLIQNMCPHIEPAPTFT